MIYSKQKFNITSADAITVFDPWLLADREAINKELLNCTRIPAVFGEDNFGNLLWGIVAQTQWQITSGRQQSQPLSTRIDENSWWANINYFLTVVPYLVAMNCKLLPATKFLPSQLNPSSTYPTVYADINPVLAQEWTNYFEAIKRLQNDPTDGTLESLQRNSWVAHNATIADVLVTFVPKINLLNIRERRFSNGFAHLVEILAILNLNTNYSQTHLNQMLPHRKLTSRDVPPLIRDMTRQQNAVISSLFVISDIAEEDSTWQGFLEGLRTGMTHAKCAEYLKQTAGDFFKNPRRNFVDSVANVLDSSFCARVNYTFLKANTVYGRVNTASLLGTLPSTHDVG